MSYEDKVLANIDKEKDNLIRMMQELIRINTVNPPGNESRAAEYLEPIFKELGFAVQLVEAEKGRANIIGTLPGKAGKPKLCMFAHTDTVPAGDLSDWVVDPFGGAIKDDKVYGRGASDHKFPMAALTIAIKAIKAAGITLNGDLIYAFTADEETGSHMGMRFLMDRNLLQSDYGIYVGPSGAAGKRVSFAPWLGEHNVIVASNGMLNYTITVKGRTSHTMSLETGINSIYKAARLILRFKEFADEVNARTHPDTGKARMSVNMINGGDKENQVPHKCKILIDRRITPSESVNQATKEIEAVIDAAKKDDPELEADVGLFEGMPTISLPKDSELVKAIQRSAVKVTGKEPLPVGISASTDMAWFAAKTGAQSALFGYGDITMAHAANEFIAIPDLVNSTKSCALIIMDILGVAN